MKERVSRMRLSAEGGQPTFMNYAHCRYVCMHRALGLIEHEAEKEEEEEVINESWRVRGGEG